MMGLAFSAGCGSAELQSDYTAASTETNEEADEDLDGDGYVAEGAGGDDCNDDDGSVHPGAAETAGDGVDSNCDGEDDT